MKWISCEEKLPENRTVILIAYEGKVIYSYYQDGVFSDCCFPSAFDKDKITHWMPLPPPPDLLEQEHKNEI